MKFAKVIGCLLCSVCASCNPVENHKEQVKQYGEALNNQLAEMPTQYFLIEVINEQEYFIESGKVDRAAVLSRLKEIADEQEYLIVVLMRENESDRIIFTEILKEISVRNFEVFFSN